MELSDVRIGGSYQLLDGREGVVKYIGPLHHRTGKWVGLHLHRGRGKHNGLVDGQRYFDAPRNRAVLVRAFRISRQLREQRACSNIRPPRMRLTRLPRVRRVPRKDAKPKPKRATASIVVPAPAKPAEEKASNVGTCPICLEDDVKLVSLAADPVACGHRACQECWTKLLQTKLKDLSAYPLQCFMNDCSCKLRDPKTLGPPILSHPEVTVAKRFTALAKLDPSLRCQCPECLAPNKRAPQKNQATCCTECAVAFCAQCDVKWHERKTCRQYERETCKDMEENVRLLWDLADNRLWKECPGCGQIVSKIDGCNHVTHEECPVYAPDGTLQNMTITHFCYACGDIMGQGNNYSSDEEDYECNCSGFDDYSDDEE